MGLSHLVSCFPSGMDRLPVQVIHACYPDCAQDESGWLFSKIAATDIGIAADRGVVALDQTEPLFTAALDRGLIGMLATASGEKIASGFDESEINALIDSLQKLADSTEADQGDVSAVEAQPSEPDDASLVKAWQSGDHSALHPLFKRYDSVIKRHASRFYGADLPHAAIDAEAKQVAMEAFKNYDGARGVRLGTYLTSYMPKIRRFVIKHQNPVRVSEDAALRVRSYRGAVDELTQKHGRPPTSGEIADHRKWSLRDVKKIRTAEGGARISELDEETPILDDGERRANIFVDYMYHELEPPEQRVLEHLYGLYGAKKIEDTEGIAKATGYSPAQTYRMRNSIAEKMKVHLDKV